MSVSQIITQKYKVGDDTLNVAEVGSGKPLLLIHGWTNDWHGWTLLANELSKSFKLYMVDLPGFGGSSQLPEHTLPAITKTLNSFLTNQQIKPYAVIGSSLGTVVAASLLEHYEDTTNNLIQLSAIFSKRITHKKSSNLVFKSLELVKPHNKIRQQVRNLVASKNVAYLIEKYANSYKFDKAMVDKYSLPGRRLITAKAYIEIGVSAHSYNMANYLEKTNKNTLLIYGDTERYVDINSIRDYVEDLNKPNLSVKIIPECGHNPAYEQPDITAKLITNFLNKIK